MNKKEFQETEEAFRAYFRKGRTEEPEEYPEFQPDFEDIKRRLEEVDSGKRVLPPLSPTPEEWNRQVRAERRQRARKIASIAAAVVVVIGVAGGAYWLGRESVVVPNPDSSAAESKAVESDSTSENSTNATTTTPSEGETSVTRLPEETVTYEEAVRLTGLPLVKADDMDGFREYRINSENEKPAWIRYVFESGQVYVYFADVKKLDLPNAQPIDNDGKVFWADQQVAGDMTVNRVRYDSETHNVWFLASFSNCSSDYTIQTISDLVF